MARYTGTITDQNGAPQAGARVLVQAAGDGSYASLTNDSGGFIPNPIVTDPLGSFVFNVAPGLYDLTYQLAKGGRIIRQLFGVQIGSPQIDPNVNAAIQSAVDAAQATTAAQIAALTTTNIGEGSRLYFTPARAAAAISGSTTATVINGVISITAPNITAALGAAPLTALGGTVAGPLLLTSNSTDPSAAATIAYVQSIAAGQLPRSNSVAATTANITLSGTQTIDGIAVTAGQIVLVKNQTTPSQNGLYVVAAGAWPRSSDMDSWAEVPGATTTVLGGTVNANATFTCNSPAGGSLGTTAITFVTTNKPGNYDASGGVTRTANIFSLTPIGAGLVLGNASGTAAPTAQTIPAILGYTPASTTALTLKADTSTVSPLLPIAPIAAKVFTGAANGTTDVAALLQTATAAGPIILPPGTFRIATAITTANLITTSPGTRLRVDGVALNAKGGIVCPKTQCFDLVNGGTVVGLPEGWLEWFVADARGTAAAPPTIEVRALMQLAFNAVVDEAVMRGGTGHYLLDGASAVSATCSVDIPQIVWRMQGTATNGLVASPSAAVASYVNPPVIRPHVDGTIPASGTALTINRSSVHVGTIAAVDVYQGLDCAGGVSNVFSLFQISGALNFGMRTRTIDQFFSGGAITALNDWVGLAGVTGTFHVGDSVSIPGSVGSVVADYTSNYAGRYRMFFNDAVPTAGMTITSSSGGSATIAAVVIGHQGGGVRTEGGVEANAWQNLDVLGGIFSLTVAGSGSPGRTGNQSYTAFTDSVYFDTPYNGAVIDGACGVAFDCWFGNTRAKDKPGAYVVRTIGVTFGEKSRFVANSGWGLQLDSTCSRTRVASLFDGNCRNFTAGPNMAELFAGGGIQGLIVSNIYIGHTGVNGISPPKAIYLESGASDYLVFSAVVARAAVDWNATGAHNRRWAVTGLGDL
jgi:hypothetical protein